MKVGEVNALNSKLTAMNNNFFVGDVFNMTLDISTAGDKYADIETPTTPSGYTRIGLMAFATTYRYYVKGVGGNRLYYNVVSPSTTSVVWIYPIYIAL